MSHLESTKVESSHISLRDTDTKKGDRKIWSPKFKHIILKTLSSTSLF